MVKLLGQELLSHREECRAQGMANGAIVRAAGYTSIRKDGRERINFCEYYENVLIAQGKMYRITVNVAELTPAGVQPIWTESFTVNSINRRSIARKVRAMTKLTGAKCSRIERNGVVYLYPTKSDEMVAYNLPA
jgi:hypothetical protein